MNDSPTKPLEKCELFHFSQHFSGVHENRVEYPWNISTTFPPLYCFNLRVFQNYTMNMGFNEDSGGNFSAKF